MPSEPKRKLAAIMFTDMVGYTALMQEDEDKARELIERHRDLMKPHVDKHNGEIIQYVGDGTFCRFDSAKEAVNAALEIQHVFKLEDDMSLRIGIHVGDVVVKGDEVYGDGVNVASRLEPLAEPGGICLSGEVYTQIKNQTKIDLIAGGSKDLKNVKDPVDIYFVGESTGKKGSVTEESLKSEISIPRKYIYSGAAVLTILLIILWNLPFFSAGDMALEASGEIRSIAVLPLDNMSNDPDQEYFSDGMTEALVSDIGNIRSLKVISRTSVMRYKGTTKSLPEIAKELKVDAILEGSVMHAEGEVRITVQLIRASTDEQIWTDSYIDRLENVLSLQGRIAKTIAKEIKLTLSPEEELKLSSEKKINPEAHEAYLRGRYFWNLRTGDDIKRALVLFQKAVDIEPLYALAHVGIAESYILLHVYTGISSQEAYLESKAAAIKALEINPNLGAAHASIAGVFSEYYWDWEAGEAEYEKALELNPNYATGHQWYAEFLSIMGKDDEAIAEVKIARELDPLSMVILRSEAKVYSRSRNSETALTLLDRNIELYPDYDKMYFDKAMFLFSQKEHDNASQMWLKAFELQKIRTEVIEEGREALRLSGLKGLFSVILGYHLKQDPINSFQVARDYYILEEYERSLDWLERTMKQRNWAIITVNRDDYFSDPKFRSDPRFQAILKKMNFPEL